MPLILLMFLPLLVKSTLSGDFQRPKGFLLEVAWRPSFCLENYCEKRWNTNDFAVSGFRAVSEAAVILENCPCSHSISELSQSVDAMLWHFYPNREKMGRDEESWELDYRRFGCCAMEESTPDSYYKKAVELLMRIHPLEQLLGKGAISGEPTTAQVVRSAFPKQVGLSCNGARLITIHLYFNDEFELEDYRGTGEEETCGEWVEIPIAGRYTDLDPGNINCVDCGKAQDGFISLNFGVTLCEKCAEIHNSESLSQVISSTQAIVHLSALSIIPYAGNQAFLTYLSALNIDNSAPLDFKYHTKAANHYKALLQDAAKTGVLPSEAPVLPLEEALVYMPDGPESDQTMVTQVLTGAVDATAIAGANLYEGLNELTKTPIIRTIEKTAIGILEGLETRVNWLFGVTPEEEQKADLEMHPV